MVSFVGKGPRLGEAESEKAAVNRVRIPMTALRCGFFKVIRWAI